MAAANVIAVGNTTANSSDLTVTTTPLLIGLKTTNGGAVPDGINVKVYVKDDGSHYNYYKSLSKSQPTLVLSAAGVYRVTRTASRNDVGVYSA
jgi:hypothetical protein